MDQAEGLRTMMKETGDPETACLAQAGPKATEAPHRTPLALCVTSGKGGVGKTNVVANLAYAFTQLGKKVLILDADLGLANIDVLLGLTPRYTIEHLFTGEKTFSEILIDGPGGMSILPASSGVFEMAHLEDHQKLFLLNEVDLFAGKIDLLLIDTGAGISSNVLYFNLAAQESIVVITPEPTSMTDAYALIKVLSTRHQKRHFTVLVNQAPGPGEALEVFKRLARVIDRFLGTLSIRYLGHVPMDEKLRAAVKLQRAVTELYPKAPSSRSFHELARLLAEVPLREADQGQIQFFWRRLLQGGAA
jgi:flagellar biosynthesis protein FlhG